MKVTIDLENLESLVKETTENNIETIIKEQVKKSVNKTIEELAKKEINNAVSSNFQKFVDEYIKNTVIKVGGNSYWDDEEQKEYTVEQYIKKELKDRLESKTLKAKKKGRTSSYSDDFEQVSFEEYINRSFNVDDLIKADLDKFMDGIRKDINKTMKDTFDSSTKNMLSSAVLSILTANDTYRQIENQIKCIADKRA
ncbi:hypothetical protein C823_007781 [Eubacterium plexicaudatum ASF492]|uniref:Uncharacterized protein n=1 Tax=Eubacterium plexicaudatum ASF492 TaxID=1235802 RepID=N1ZVR9_9FIRM|nr:hypothetical protein [Thomasclavelia cocleata]KAI4445274.1 hypothetical protein C823_007781 [Eubacterium plexicaudatum ASF492]